MLARLSGCIPRGRWIAGTAVTGGDGEAAHPLRVRGRWLGAAVAQRCQAWKAVRCIREALSRWV
jgi:hypothetical protein